MAMKDRNQAFRHSNIFHTIITKSSKVEIQTLYIHKFISGVINMTASPWWFFFHKNCSKGKIMKTNLFLDKLNMLGKKGWIENTYRADSRIVPHQWETALLCNDVSHWLGSKLESALTCREHLWNTIHNISPIHWNIQFYTMLNIYELLDFWAGLHFFKYLAGPWYVILQWTQIFISKWLIIPLLIFFWVLSFLFLTLCYHVRSLVNKFSRFQEPVTESNWNFDIIGITSNLEKTEESWLLFLTKLSWTIWKILKGKLVGCYCTLQTVFSK